MGDDISEQLEEYRESIENGCHQDIPTSFSPRSLRPTVRWWKREDRSLENANKEGAGQLTFTQSRVSHPKKVKADEQQQSPHKKSLPISDAPKKVQLDIDSLDPLTTEEVLKPQSTTDEIKIMVDSSESIRVLELEIDHTIHHAKTLAESVDYSVDEVVLESVWGLDAEWKPGKNCGSDNPVSTLQLSTQRCSFLIDLQSLCQSLHLEDSCDESAQSETELELNRILSKLFQESNIPIIGFGVLADLGKMAASFPHMPCFSLYNGVIDLQIVSSIVLPKPDAQFASSLQKTVALVLQRRLLKKQQCFDWTTRPLSSEQIEYATLDAAVLPYLLKQIMGDNVLERYNGQLFNEYPHLISNIRFTFLQDTSEPTGSERVLWEIPMGKVTSLFSKQLARQCWPASSPSISDFPTKRVLPAEPLKPTLTKKERAHLRKVGTGKRPKPVQLKDLTGKLDDLPKVGTVMGYTKDTCVHRVLGHEFIKARPERTHIGFNRRSGVSELTNCYVLFCNFGGVYRSSSGFLKEGREFRFNLKSNDKAAKSSEKSLYDFFSSWRQEVFDKKILLFARGSTKHKYLYCGECKYKGVFPTEDESMDLHLNLINYSEVVSKDDSEEFFELIRIGAAEYPSI